MSLPKIQSYEVKNSRTDQKVPVVNGVHLHSIYNPFKEAQALVEKYADQLTHKNEVLILGLGFAYHVNEIINYMTRVHGDNFRIVIVEPNAQIYHDCLNLDLLNKKNVLVYSGFLPQELYSDIDLIHFLLRKPAVIAHPPSFNLYQDYFKEVLTFEAPKKIEAIQEYLTSNEVKRYLAELEAHETFDNFLYNDLPGRTEMKGFDFLCMALSEMTKNAKEVKEA
ncbi:MAG: hypothetical protein L6Q33_01565 [Bacteriovoracaceae bacterium]|jgi:hypothetical protein|nr:hypothetical protein [Bacteriovoracaceae bacterium]